MNIKHYKMNKDSSKISDCTIDVSEIFHSLQGESSFAGLPCCFIRLAGCNLRCAYCDTEYALTKENSIEMRISEIVRKISSFNTKLVEITGGEPLAQKNVFELMESLISNGFKILLETNGSYSIGDIPEIVTTIMDCKCPSSGESEKMNYANFSLLTTGDEVKFVIADEKDYKYAINIIEKYKLAEKQIEILFSAVSGISPSFPGELANWITEDNLPVRFQLQIHKIIWNDAKGK